MKSFLDDIFGLGDSSGLLVGLGLSDNLGLGVGRGLRDILGLGVRRDCGTRQLYCRINILLILELFCQKSIEFE